MVKWSELKRASDTILAVWPHYQPLFERWFMQELVYKDEHALMSDVSSYGTDMRI
ncbi:hypothetical protein [Thioclava sp. SK-1]|uniref:hypothetical protein n=1 Tax=Thioclava sp. SK-1 TaxID=1889770 RepID=UPI00159EF896|nr:hypothetical protein [Thioclava sp. SK-1]